MNRFSVTILILVFASPENTLNYVRTATDDYINLELDTTTYRFRFLHIMRLKHVIK